MRCCCVTALPRAAGYLLGATIDSNVECCGAALENWSETGSRETLQLTDVEIAGDVLLNLGFTALGMSASGAPKWPRPRLLDGDLHRLLAGGLRTIDGRGDGGDQPGGRR